MSQETRWSDGICTYEMSPPLEGYFVSRDVFGEGHKVPLERVLAAARRMTDAELRSYVSGGTLKESEDLPLFVFKNHRVNVFLWKGHPQVHQHIILRVLQSDSTWMHQGQGLTRADALECVFYLPPWEQVCHVMLDQSGRPGQDSIHTDRVYFGHFPPVQTILSEGIKSADAVVYLPGFPKDHTKGMLDCLKGSLSAEELQALPGIERLSNRSFVFLARDGAGYRIRSTCTQSEVYVDYRGDYGELRLSIPNHRDVLAKDKSLESYGVSPPLRWHLARRTSGGGPKSDAGCVLTAQSHTAERGEWLILELVVGTEAPGGDLLRPAMMRHQRDGGDPLFHFTLRHDGKEVTLRPPWRRREWPPLRQPEPESKPEQERRYPFEYSFVFCDRSVVKLAIRPKEHPWKAEVQAHWLELPRFGGGPAKSHTSTKVMLEVR